MSLEHAYWVCLVLNFGLIAGVIIWFSKTKLPGMFRSRTASIQKALEEARRASADSQIADWPVLRPGLPNWTWRSEKCARRRREAVAEEQKIEVTATMSEKWWNRRSGKSWRQPKPARRELTAYAADLAVTLATQQIRINFATDQALVRDFAQQLPGNGEPRRGG